MYIIVDLEYMGRVMELGLWDKQEEIIGNNESIEIMRMFATSFDDYGNGIDFYPAGHRNEDDRIIDAVYDSFNNGVYRAGFGKWREAYDHSIKMP